jgi:hypothetical protein
VKKNELSPDQRPWASTSFLLLEWVTAAVLVLVLAALGWMAAADRLPTACRLPSLEMEILAVLGLLTVALLLVSVLALFHTKEHSA